MNTSELKVRAIWCPATTVAPREGLEVQRRARPDHEPKRVEQRDDHGRHASSLSKNARNLNGRTPYGVSGRQNYEELTLREIGEVLGVTESRVSQLHTKAILRLKARLGGAARVPSA